MTKAINKVIFIQVHAYVFKLQIFKKVEDFLGYVTIDIPLSLNSYI